MTHCERKSRHSLIDYGGLVILYYASLYLAQALGERAAADDREIGVAQEALHRVFVHQAVAAEDAERLLAHLVAALGLEELRQQWARKPACTNVMIERLPAPRY